LYVGQLAPLKRVDLVIRAVAAARSRGIDVRGELVYHHGPEENALHALAHDLGVQEQVAFTGALNRTDLAQRMRASHVLCLPSMTEALPSVVTEAALSGLPVLATAVGGIAEQVPEPDDLVPLGAVESFPSRVVDALADYGHRARVAHSWAATAQELFSVSAMLDAHEQLYERLCVS
jgi:glycosyltransferase involved in cell wall biosynthesis